MLTPRNHDQANGMVSFEIAGFQGKFICEKLKNEFNIHISEVYVGKLNGVRISPAIFNSKQELLKLIDGIKTILAIVK